MLSLQWQLLLSCGVCHFAVCLAGADHEVMWRRGKKHARGQEHARVFSLAFMTENNSLDLQ